MKRAIFSRGSNIALSQKVSHQIKTAIPDRTGRIGAKRKRPQINGRLVSIVPGGPVVKTKKVDAALAFGRKREKGACSKSLFFADVQSMSAATLLKIRNERGIHGPRNR